MDQNVDEASKERVTAMLDEIHRQPRDTGSDYVRAAIERLRPRLPKIRQALVEVMRDWIAQEDEHLWFAMRIAGYLRLVELKGDLLRYRDKLLDASDTEHALLLPPAGRQYVHEQAQRHGPEVLETFRRGALRQVDAYVRMMEAPEERMLPEQGSL